MEHLLKATIITIMISFSSLYASETDAHNHSHDEHKHGYESLKKEISKKNVEEIAKKEVTKLANEKKIHMSWKNVPISMIGKTHYGDTNDWKVGFTNYKIKNKKRQTLYIFVSVRGKVVGANYTGK